MGYSEAEIDACLRAVFDGDVEEMDKQKKGEQEDESCDYYWPFGTRT